MMNALSLLAMRIARFSRSFGFVEFGKSLNWPPIPKEKEWEEVRKWTAPVEYDDDCGCDTEYLVQVRNCWARLYFCSMDFHSLRSSLENPEYRVPLPELRAGAELKPKSSHLANSVCAPSLMRQSRRADGGAMPKGPSARVGDGDGSQIGAVVAGRKSIRRWNWFLCLFCLCLLTTGYHEIL